MRIISAASLAIVLLLSACGSEQEPDVSADFAALLDEHFERSLALNPVNATSIGEDQYDDQYANSIGPEHRAARHDLNVEFLSRLGEIDRAELSAQDKLSFDMFKLRREVSLAGEQFPSDLLPMNQYYLRLLGIRIFLFYPMASLVKDYITYLKFIIKTLFY